MFKFRKRLIFSVFLFFLFSFFTFKYQDFVYANFDCLTLESSSSEENKNYCRNELQKIEAELSDLLEKQKQQQKNTGTLKGDVAYLNAQINALKTKIKSRSLVIANLKVSIKDKALKINNLENKISSQHQSLAQLVRNTNDIDNQNLTHLLLSKESVFDFYGDLTSYDSIKEAVSDSLDIIKDTKSTVEEQKKDLEEKQDQELDAKAELENSQKKISKSEAEKKLLLSLSKKKEDEYKKLATEKKAKADKIRSRLFSLAGISQKIEFGTALKYANEVSQKTNVEPAFLLAILTQESNLGSNVGKCYLTDISGERAGYGIGISTGKIWTNLMKPSRDIPPFLEITSYLGFDPLKTAVSCPVAGIAGYGGAMGPAQFIPSTWKSLADRLQNLLGHFANPWDPRDAFMASGLYLSDLKGTGSSTSAQLRAACRYYGTGGSTCSYGRSVQSLKNKIQDDIDLLSN